MEEAIEARIRTKELNPEDWAYPYNLGLDYQRLGRWAEAIREFELAVGLYHEFFGEDHEFWSAVLVLIDAYTTCPDPNLPQRQKGLAECRANECS